MASNSETAPQVYINEAELEWQCYDALPKALRACLREAMQDYSAEQVLQDYQNRFSARQDFLSIEQIFGGKKIDPIAEIASNIRRLDEGYAADYRHEMRTQRIRMR